MKRRWLKRLFLVATVLVLTTLGAGFYTYLNLRDVVVWFANRGHPRLVLDVRRAAMHWNRVELSEVLLRLPKNNEEVVRIDSATIEFSWRDLRKHNIGAVTVNKPRVRIADRLLEAAQNETTALTTSQTEATT